MDKKHLIEQLIVILNDLGRYYSRLYSLLKKEKEVMVKKSLEELEVCTKEKETIALKIRILDESRLIIVRKISQISNIPESDLTMSQVGELIGGENRERLKKISSRLSSLVKEVGALNNENRAFVELFMNHIKITISYVNQVKSDEVTYLSSGEAKGVQGNGRVLCKA